MGNPNNKSKVKITILTPSLTEISSLSFSVLFPREEKLLFDSTEEG